MVSRRPSDIDRRLILIEITPQGRELLVADARQQTIWLIKAMEAKLSGTEQGLLALAIPLLARLSAEV